METHKREAIGFDMRTPSFYGYKLGDEFLYCPNLDCDFQLRSGQATYSICPVCKERLHIWKIEECDLEKELKIDDKVLTVKSEKVSNDWMPTVLNSRKFDVTGKIVRISNAHGLCYEVLHSDGSSSYYDPWELKKV